ncbi:hypothetical protein Taro_022320 [Colocasia esculenta]|uniref:Uncharacterized protein n=1 Tax=Colocasia esculenta TaxID=4460 RepID=A0A843V137_COLES|nr:hypothetical protein [Colocasia esculenta]
MVEDARAVHEHGTVINQQPKEREAHGALSRQEAEEVANKIIEPLYEVLRVVDGDRRPSIGFVYAKLEAAKKKICEVSPQYAHLVFDVVEDRWDRQMSRDLHMAAYYLHPAYHYTHELAYEDDLTAAFTRVVERLSRSPVQAADAIDEVNEELSGAWMAESGRVAGSDPADPNPSRVGSVDPADSNGV